MKKQVVLFFLLSGLLPLISFGQSYADWDEHDVVRFYEKIDLDSYALNEEGEDIEAVYVPTKIKDGLYEVEVYKVSSKLYQIKGTSIYMYFRFSPYLYSNDEGVLEVSYNSGTFYEKP
jgi:hypothetical protein